MNKLLKMSWLDYVASKGVNASLLGELEKSPLHAQAYLNQPKDEPKACFTIGTITHALVLEPEHALDNVAVKPEGMSFVTKEGKEWKAAHAGKEIISCKERNNILGMCASILRHPFSKKIFEQGDSEQALFADWEGLVQRKGRVDHLPPGNIIADIKTSGKDVTRRNFERSVFDFGYHIKASYYIDLAKSLGLDKTVFLLIAVEVDPPHGVIVYQLEPDAVDAGRKKYESLLRLWHHCETSGKWPGYDEAVQLIGLPAWVKT